MGITKTTLPGPATNISNIARVAPRWQVPMCDDESREMMKRMCIHINLIEETHSRCVGCMNIYMVFSYLLLFASLKILIIYIKFINLLISINNSREWMMSDSTLFMNIQCTFRLLLKIPFQDWLANFWQASVSHHLSFGMQITALSTQIFKAVIFQETGYLVKRDCRQGFMESWRPVHIQNCCWRLLYSTCSCWLLAARRYHT